MNITIIQRNPLTIQAGGYAIKPLTPSIALPFARKPVDLDDVENNARQNGENIPVYVLETKELTTAEFDTFAGSLLDSREWLAGKGGGKSDGYLCVEVIAPGRPRLYVNPEGSDYARYIARLD